MLLGGALRAPRDLVYAEEWLLAPRMGWDPGGGVGLGGTGPQSGPRGCEPGRGSWRDFLPSDLSLGGVPVHSGATGEICPFAEESLSPDAPQL